MASRPKGYGMTAELDAKKNAKFDPDLCREASEWIDEKTGERNLNSESTSEGMHEKLKDGVNLCNLINAIRPGSVKKINTNKMAFKQMENISNFLAGCEAMGVNKVDLFQTVDLYEAQNMPQVINGILALGRKCGHGLKESVGHKREFTEEQLRAGDGIIGLQAGSNKGASQAGQNFGKTRSILD